jgi:adenosylcobinamide-phosphate synthase
MGAGIGLALDRAVGEPPATLHPVVGFGSLMRAVERTTYRDTRGAGSLYTLCGAAVALAAGAALRSTAVGVGASAAGRMLRTEAAGIRDRLGADDLDGARRALPALVGRDPSALDASGVAAAVIESVGENTVDAVVAPALWGAIFGARGALVLRAINTMDAMVGHRSTRYARFGWASARADDVANFVPARVTAALVMLVRPGRARAVWEVVRSDAGAHPSPNAGVAEAAFAAALDRELGGPLRYGDRHEDRPRLGRGPRPAPADIDAAIRLADDVERALALGLLAAGAFVWLTSPRAPRTAP